MNDSTHYALDQQAAQTQAEDARQELVSDVREEKMRRLLQALKDPKEFWLVASSLGHDVDALVGEFIDQKMKDQVNQKVSGVGQVYAGMQSTPGFAPLDFEEKRVVCDALREHRNNKAIAAELTRRIEAIDNAQEAQTQAVAQQLYLNASALGTMSGVAMGLAAKSQSPKKHITKVVTRNFYDSATNLLKWVERVTTTESQVITERTTYNNNPVTLWLDSTEEETEVVARE